VWIEIDFDDRIFPEYVWSDFFRSARALRHVTGHELERVRISGHAVPVDGEPLKVVRVSVTVRVSDDPRTRTFEFASGGLWRVRVDGASPGEEETPFELYMPEAGHDYERDLLHRIELQIGILQNQVKRFIREVREENGERTP
jgi:hypothetical protein